MVRIAFPLHSKSKANDKLNKMLDIKDTMATKYKASALSQVENRAWKYNEQIPRIWIIVTFPALFHKAVLRDG